MGLSMPPALAQVDGESETPGGSCPPGAVTGHAGQPSWDTFFECNSSNQWQRGPYFFGSTSDTCDSNHAGLTQWTGSVMEYCNGSAWTQFEPVQSTPVETAPAGSGYFVLSGGTYTGNLGTLAAADATCLTDLTTNTGWQGYSTANSNGQLVSGKVHVFLCTGTNGTDTCNNLMPLTTYYFANAGNSSAGGASFTTTSGSLGPNDTNSWAAANYFSGTYTYFSNRTATSNSVWANTPSASNANTCNGFSNSTSAFNYAGATSASTTSTRCLAPAVNFTCDQSAHLICFVNP